MIDDEDFGRTFDSIHSETELFLDRGEERWRRSGFVLFREIIGPFESEIVPPWKRGLIDNRPVLIEIHVQREVWHRHVGEL